MYNTMAPYANGNSTTSNTSSPALSNGYLFNKSYQFNKINKFYNKKKAVWYQLAKH